MKKYLFTLIAACFMSNIAYSQEYDKDSGITWYKDSVSVSGKEKGIKIEVSLFGVSEYWASLILENNSDASVKVNWSRSIFHVNEQSILPVLARKVDLVHKTQIEEIPINGYANASFELSSIENYFLPIKRFKKAYKQTKEKVEVVVQLSFSIIYKDKSYDVDVIKKGFYEGKKR